MNVIVDVGDLKAEAIRLRSGIHLHVDFISFI